jgi:hypothetical protein
VPISAQLKYNVDVVCEYICKRIPVPVRDFVSPPQMIVIRSFDVNKPGSEVDELKGGVAGGSILQVRAPGAAAAVQAGAGGAGRAQVAGRRGCWLLVERVPLGATAGGARWGPAHCRRCCRACGSLALQQQGCLGSHASPHSLAHTRAPRPPPLPQGVLRMGQEIEVRPGIVTKDAQGSIKCLPIFSRIVSLFAEQNELQYAVPGGLIGERRRRRWRPGGAARHAHAAHAAALESACTPRCTVHLPLRARPDAAQSSR